MMWIRKDDAIPLEFVFTPRWWNGHYGVSFDADFYLDRETRIHNDILMRRALTDRFGRVDTDAGRRPLIGSEHVAGGFVLPALFGAQVRFTPDEAPWPATMNLGREQVMALQPPDLRTTWPMDVLLADMDALESEYGYVVGDFDTDGILNTALCLRGQALFTDLVEDKELIHHLFGVVAETILRVADAVRTRTGTCSVATNRSILNVDRGLYLHSNCSVQMISPVTYREFLLPYELVLTEKLQPYGIHHCGHNLHLYVKEYGHVPAVFFDVGWGSDVAKCRSAFPQAFLNLRLSPVRLLRETAETVRQDVKGLLRAVGGTEGIGVCCINMDYGTPDENVRAVMDAVAGRC